MSEPKKRGPKKGFKHSEETKRKMSESAKNRSAEAEARRIAAMRASSRYQETRGFRGDSESRKRIGEATKRNAEAGVYKKAAVKAWETRRGWSDKKKDEYSKKLSDSKKKQWAEGVYDNMNPAPRRRVSQMETALIPILEALGYQHNDSENPGYFFIPFGRGSGLVPDFVDREGRRVFEFFGGFWHHPDDEPDYVRLYKEAGWECQVLWEADLKKFAWEHRQLVSEDVVSEIMAMETNATRGNPEMVPRRSEMLRDKEDSDATDSETS